MFSDTHLRCHFSYEDHNCAVAQLIRTSDYIIKYLFSGNNQIVRINYSDLIITDSKFSFKQPNFHLNKEAFGINAQIFVYLKQIF